MIDAVPFRFAATGIGEIVGEVVRRQHRRPQPQPVERAQHAQVAVQIEAALQVEQRRDPPRLGDALDRGGVESQLDLVAMLFELPQRQVHQLHRALDFVPPGIILLHRSQAQEDGVESALANAGHVHLAVAVVVGDLSALVELAIDQVDVRVHHKGRLAPRRRGPQDSHQQFAHARL